MKLRNKLAAITAAAMLAFTGVGFAAWTFTKVENAQVSTIEDRVAVGIELNAGFKLYNAADNAEVDSLYLICDAPTDAVANRYLAGAGVYWATDEAGVNEITNVYIKGTLSKNLEDEVKDKTSVTVQFTATHNLAENSYVTFGNMTAPANKVVENITSTAANYEVKSVNFALPSVTYTATAIAIEDIAGLTAMNTALGTALSGKALSFTAQIVA